MDGSKRGIRHGSPYERPGPARPPARITAVLSPRQSDVIAIQYKVYSMVIAVKAAIPLNDKIPVSRRDGAMYIITI